MQTQEPSNISRVVKLSQCTSCGTCSAFCPKEAIRLNLDDAQGVFLPDVDLNKCNSCGICLKVCPGAEVNFETLSKHVFGKENLSHGLLGHFCDCYVGGSNSYDSSLTPQVASGGVATQLLTFALEQGLIDGALVTRMSEKEPLKPESFVATTTAEILSAAGSKYCSCPTNIGLRKLVKSEGKFAVVGLPCQIHAVRKAQLAFPALKKKIPVAIGLFCAHATTRMGTDVILRKLKLTGTQVSKLTYRGHGWPGYLTAETNDGGHYSLPYAGSFRSYYPVFDSYFFVPWRCLFCQDHFNTLADISLGDAWLPEFKGSNMDVH